MLRKNSIVKLADWYLKELKKNFSNHELLEEEFVFLGEIPNMKCHCNVIGINTSKIFSGYHLENFEEICED